MHIIKNIYNTETLLGMLDTAISLMIENDICYCCPVSNDRSKKICNDVDLCRAYIFEGLLKIVRIDKGKKCISQMNTKKL